MSIFPNILFLEKSFLSDLNIHSAFGLQSKAITNYQAADQQPKEFNPTPAVNATAHLYLKKTLTQ